MTDLIDPSWRAVLEDEFTKEYFVALSDFVDQQYNDAICFPPKQEIFAALNHCKFQDVKVVIIGQDPYHGDNQAHGLSFSVRDGVAFPPSLRNIFREIQDDLGAEIPFSGNLERWADQGVLLLNAILTVKRSEAGSHAGQNWEKFTDAILREVSNRHQNIVFMLWGGYAKKKGKICHNGNHLILESGHPSPLSANQGLWFNNKHFSKTNNYLESVGKKPIHW